MSLKIMVVDDQESISGLIKAFLEKSIPDCQVSTFNRSSLAIEAMDQEIPDIVIFDWNMPQCGGEIVVKAAINSRVPNNNIFAITKRSLSDIQEIQKLGIGGYFERPFNPQEILEKINLILEEIALALAGD